LIAGRGVGAVFYPEHVNAYDPQLDLVFDLPNLYFSTLDDWRGSHYLGRDETPAPVYAFLAGLLLNLSEEKEAPFAPAFAAALRLHPISALHVAALVATKNPDLIGLAEAGKLVSENPGHPLSHAVLAYTLSREGRFDESSAALRTALALKRTLGETPHGAVMGLKPMMDIAMRTALIVCTSGRFQEGVELLQEMLASEPENGEILGVLGTLHCMKASQSSEDPSSAGDFEKAAGFLKQALRFVPEEKPVALDVAFNLGIALLGLNRDLDEILPHWRRAVAVSERHRAQLSSVLERLRQSGDPRDGERARRIEEDLRKPD
jgi:tetratricopeptide (TPR) repeat protein